MKCNGAQRHTQAVLNFRGFHFVTGEPGGKTGGEGDELGQVAWCFRVIDSANLCGGVSRARSFRALVAIRRASRDGNLGGAKRDNYSRLISSELLSRDSKSVAQKLGSSKWAPAEY